MASHPCGGYTKYVEARETPFPEGALEPFSLISQVYMRHVASMEFHIPHSTSYLEIIILRDCPRD
jgi:hypothetical protein